VVGIFNWSDAAPHRRDPSHDSQLSMKKPRNVGLFHEETRSYLALPLCSSRIIDTDGIVKRFTLEGIYEYNGQEAANFTRLTDFELCPH